MRVTVEDQTDFSGLGLADNRRRASGVIAVSDRCRCRTDDLTLVGLSSLPRVVRPPALARVDP